MTKPWLQLPSNCIIPVGLAQQWLSETDALQGYWKLCGGLGGLINQLSFWQPLDPTTGLPYDPLYYDGTDGRPVINGGAGIAKHLGGNELPNAPHWTVNIGAQYGFDLLEGPGNDAPTYPFRSAFQFDEDHRWLFLGRDWQRLKRLFASYHLPLYQAASDLTPACWREISKAPHRSPTQHT